MIHLLTNAVHTKEFKNLPFCSTGVDSTEPEKLPMKFILHNTAYMYLAGSWELSAVMMLKNGVRKIYNIFWKWYHLFSFEPN